LDSDVERRLSAAMKSAQDGDCDAYEALLIEVVPLLRHFVRSQLRGADWADDAVQEALIAIHRNRHTYDPSRPFPRWMYAIARHRVIDLARERRRRRAREDLGDSRLEDLPFAPPSDGPGYETLHRALAALSHAQREVIRMLKWDGFSVKEIAANTGSTESAVKIRAHRGYEILRGLLGSDTDED